MPWHPASLAILARRSTSLQKIVHVFFLKTQTGNVLAVEAREHGDAQDLRVARIVLCHLPQESLSRITVNRHKPGTVGAGCQEGPPYGLRDVVELQVQEDSRRGDFADGLQNPRPLAHEEFQTYLEETHVILQKGHVFYGLFSGRDIQGEDDVVLGAFHD